jgi:hypothetical protein
MSEDNWLESLPEPLREAPYLKAAESPEDALAKIQHAAKLVGTSVRIPGEDTSEEDKDAFYTKLTEVDGVARLPTHDDIEGVMALLGKLGYPEEHTGYKLPEVKDFEWDQDMGEALRKYAHESGLTPGQFEALATRIARQEQDADLISNTELSDQQKALRQDWGDTLETREDLIRGWLKMSEAPQSMTEMVNDRKLPLDTMNWLLGIAKQFEGDVTPVGGDGKGGPAPITATDAKIKIGEILKDLTGMRDSDPRYRPLQQQLVEMQRVAIGS